MSSISINANDQSLFNFYQNLSTGASTPTVAAPAVAPADPQSPAAPTAAPADPQAAAPHHHPHGGLFKKIESAVTSALQTAKSDPTADPNQVVEDAIAKVFKDSGITPPTGTNSSAGVKPDSDGDGDKDAATPDSSQVSSARQAFLQTLQGFGVDASQFHSDFLAAIKDAQTGNSDSSSLFQSFPPGSSLDTTA